MFFENRKLNDSTDTVDVALRELLEAIRLSDEYHEKYITEKNFLDLEDAKPWNINRLQQLSSQRISNYDRYLTARAKLYDAIDSHPDWIYRFKSSLGETFVHTRQEAVEIEAPIQLLTKQVKKEHLDGWKKTALPSICSQLTPIKVGINGGACPIPRAKYP